MIGSATIFRRRLLAWYTAHRRDLPWRVDRAAEGTRPDPYAVLVSEAMLQQTQVATVIEFYKNFMRRFPTLRALADAPEQAVLRHWQGLGYYSRARNLQRAAREILDRFGGNVPSAVESLLTLPGVGRYTAGAIASLAHDVPAPIVDGNVARVLCRVDLVREDPRERETQTRLWARAEELVVGRHPGDFNSAMMELGATVCTPRSPACLICPVREHCRAAAEGLAEVIPPPRKAKPLPLRRRVVLCLLRRGSGGRGPTVRIEQRPAGGRWARLWQFVTRSLDDGTAGSAWAALRSEIGDFSTPWKMLQIRHQLTHRRYEFDVFAAEAKSNRETHDSGSGRWVTLDELSDYPLPRPHVLIADALRAAQPAGSAPAILPATSGKSSATCPGGR